jgi:hypothetical protein
MFAVEVLMQAVVVARSVLQQERRRASLPGGMATLEEGRVICGKTHPKPHPLVPAVGNRREMRVERRANLLHERRKRIGEIAVFALPESVPRHQDMAAKARTDIVKAGDAVAL